MMTRLIPLASQDLHRRHVADAAAELDRHHHGFEDAVDRIGVARRAGEGAVEVDDVQILEALYLEGMGLARRVAVEHRRLRHVALPQAHGEAFLEVDGGEKDHERGTGVYSASS